MNPFLRTVFVTVLTIASLVLAQPNQAFAQTTADEEAAIKKVIISEGDAWVRHDLQAWVDAWLGLIPPSRRLPTHRDQEHYLIEKDLLK